MPKIFLSGFPKEMIKGLPHPTENDVAHLTLHFDDRTIVSTTTPGLPKVYIDFLVHLRGAIASKFTPAFVEQEVMIPQITPDSTKRWVLLTEFEFPSAVNPDRNEETSQKVFEKVDFTRLSIIDQKQAQRRELMAPEKSIQNPIIFDLLRKMDETELRPFSEADRETINQL